MQIILLSLFVALTISISPACELCHHIVNFIQHKTPEQPSVTILKQISLQYCVHQHMQVRHVCKGAIDQMTQFIANSVWRHYTDPHLVCGQVKLCKKQYEKRNLTLQINKIIKDKPDKQWEQPTFKKNLKIMHISDLHPDLFYVAGAPADCSEPVCCRMNVSHQNVNIWEQFEKATNGNFKEVQPQQGVKAAGYWGSIASCDLPLQTFELFLRDLEKMDLDLILWTGDNTPHDVWQQTQSYNMNYTMLLTQRLKKFTNATILPTIGNHESWPVNVYDFEGDREDVFKGGLASAWRSWIGEQAYQQFKVNGFYKKVIPELNNMKLISLNTQAGNNLNWFLLRDPTDPGRMLEWLQKQLQDSQKNDQLVWIIGHISPKSSVNQWAMRYNALVDRFQYTIRGQFFGHSHVDHVAFFPSIKNKGKLSGYFMISPSITTATYKNPQYRIMDVDYDTLQVTEYYQYMLNLSTNPTKDSNPKFELFYTFKDAYDLKDITVHGGMTDLYEKLRDSKEYQQKYTYLMHGGLEKGKAGKSAFCDTTTAPQYKQQCEGHSSKTTLFDRVAGPWKDLKHK